MGANPHGIRRPNSQQRKEAVTALRPEDPFLGLLIIDLTHVLAGPFGAYFFNDLEARVMKIAAGLGGMPGNVMVLGRAEPVERQSARALSRISIVTHAHIACLSNER
jgi:crotonobetainyl-CoA:carnitine CoA-transferase CaiB-like acyl-CoA transferase